MRNLIRKTTIVIMLLFAAVYAHAQGLTANFTANTTSGCSPLIVNFNDLSTGNITSWFWDFGNGATSTLKNPSTTYFNEGVYDVKLTVTNAQGSNTLTRQAFITIYGKPGAAFMVSDSNGCFPVRSQFTDLSTASIGTTNNTWFWDFGDGTQSTEQNPLHVYTASGNNTVTLKITNDKGCYSVLTKSSYIRVSAGVTSKFTNTQALTCKPPFSINFNASSTGSGNLSYLWDFGDGTTATTKTSSHVYNTTGNYSVSLTTTSSNGCSDTLVKTSLINTQDINTSFTVPDQICINVPLSFLNTSTPKPDSSLWKFGDGSTSSDTTPVKTYATAGTYKVTLYNTYSYCKDSVKKSITIAPNPVANFSPDKTFQCQPPFDVNFKDLSANAVSWFWDFGDGTTSTLQNPTHTYTNFGTYAVKLMATNASGCTDSLQKDTLIQIIKPVIDVPLLPVAGCIPFTIKPVASVVTKDNVTSYLWDFGDGATSNAATPTHIYSSQGTYTITLTITTSTGCTEVYTLPEAVKVGTVPNPKFSAKPLDVCASQRIQFTDLTDISDGWLWEFGDGTTSGSQNPTHVYSDTGYFNIKLTAINNGCSATVGQNRYVHIKPPVARFTNRANCNNKLEYSFIDQSIGAKTWSWDFGDGTTSNARNPTHTFPDYATYRITLTVTNDTCSSSITRSLRVFKENPVFEVSDTAICKQNTIQFHADVADTTHFRSYVWDFGDGNLWSSADSNTGGYAYHYYPTTGWYNVTLTTRDISGCRTVLSRRIRVNGPTANFSATDTSGCQGLTTTFNDISKNDGVNNVVSRAWDFGDGTMLTSNTSSIQHTYVNAGTYSTRLTVTDAFGCTDTVSRNNLIHATNPIADFSVDTLACPGSSLSFKNTSSDTAAASSWDFGNGGTSKNKAPTYSYAATGNYNVVLKITDQYGCSDTATKAITVDKPIASFTVSDSASSCSPFEVQFTNTSHYVKSQTWDLGNGKTTRPNPTKFYVTPGTYKIQLAVTSPGGCRDTAYTSITLYDTIGSKITYQPLNGCKPLSVDLIASSKGPVNYTWDFGDGILINNTVDTLNHIYDFFGDFVPKIILTDPTGCIIPVKGLDTIRIIGTDAKFGLDHKFFCDSGLVTFTDSTTFNDPITSYTWNYGDGTTSSQQDPGTHYYSAPGLYTVSLQLLTKNNCEDTFTLKDAIKIVQSPLIRIDGDSVICVNDFMKHFGIFERPDTSAVQWLWQLPNGNAPADQNPQPQQYATAGNFVITTIATNSSGCKDTATKNILVNPLPVITVPSPVTKQAGFPLVIPATYTSNVISYNWIPATNLSCADCPQPTTTTKFNTKYTVAFVDSNGCRNTGHVQVIVVCPNANVFVPNTFSPNGDGSNDVFYVRGRGLERVKSLRIFNRWGEVVFEKMNFPVNDPLYGWNGTYKGNKPHPDVYVYQIEVFCENSDIIRFEGNVALIQ